ncbi:uncharacterized protein LOC128723804 [Anopheles nili]|uniref:uncharacterized protein LOC128723804 n=1 Tax=Anopheles nili TaxID=185578 RepID=UPI00237A8D47|nr:uncharacterized protein LOC128723804 [Anopheles nili]
MNEDALILSNDSGFHSDWKSIYHRDALFWASHEYHTDPIMKTIVRTVFSLAKQFNLSPAIEFTVIDTLELLLVRVFQSWMQLKATSLQLLHRKKEAFLRQLPLYTVAVVDIVAKYIDASVKLNLVALKRAAKASVSCQNMLTIEFEVIKILDSELQSSLLLGAVERFSKEYLLPLNITSKENIAVIGLKLLRLATSERLRIYDSLKASIRDRDSFHRFKSSKLILAGSIVITILHLLPTARRSKAVLNQILEPLADDCCVQATNLIYLRDAMLRVISNR